MQKSRFFLTVTDFLLDESITELFLDAGVFNDSLAVLTLTLRELILEANYSCMLPLTAVNREYR